jgi:hypothetical protein
MSSVFPGEERHFVGDHIAVRPMSRYTDSVLEKLGRDEDARDDSDLVASSSELEAESESVSESDDVESDDAESDDAESDLESNAESDAEESDAEFEMDSETKTSEDDQDTDSDDSAESA